MLQRNTLAGLSAGVVAGALSGQAILPTLMERTIGALGMKPLESGKATALECLHDAMTLPASTVLNGVDSMTILVQALLAARTIRPWIDDLRNDLLARTAPAAVDGHYEPFKTTSAFDGAALHPEHLGPPPGQPG